MIERIGDEGRASLSWQKSPTATRYSLSANSSLHHIAIRNSPICAGTHLFLLALLGLGLGLGSLLPDTGISGLGSGDSQLAVGTLLSLGQGALLDLLEAVLDADAGVDGQDGREFA